MTDDTWIQAQGQRLNLPLGPVCGKKRHYDRAEADGHREALERLDQARGLTNTGTLVTYWCDMCKDFHVGHSSPDM
jgi:hypothetical protein